MAKWMTSNRELVEALMRAGIEPDGTHMEGLTAYFEFRFGDDLTPSDLSDAVLVAMFEELPEDHDGDWRTDNMLVVAFLWHKGVQPRDTQWDRGSMFWVYDDSDKLADEATQFYGMADGVDLTIYNQEVARLRKEVLDARDTRRREVVGERDARAARA